MSGSLDLLLTYDFPPMGGGISRYMAEIARGYPEGELIVSTGRLDGAERSDPLLRSRIDRIATPANRLKTLPGLVQWSRRVSALAEQEKAGFVWCGNIRPAAYPAKWLRERTGIPYGITLHGGDLLALRHNYLSSRLKRLTARALLGGAEVLVANSRFTGDLTSEVLSDLGLSSHAERVKVVPLGTDPARFRPAADPEPFRRAYALGPGTWMLTVARLVPHKGIDTAIQVLARLAPRFAELRYAVVGQGEYRRALEALARDLGVGDRVRILTDVPDEALPGAYAHADLYIGLSRRQDHDVEGFGISFLEASASAKPVVAGRSGGIPDAVREGETGLLVDPGDAAAAALVVGSLLDDREHMAVLGRSGRRAVETFYNWPRVVAELRALSAAARSARR